MKNGNPLSTWPGQSDKGQLEGALATITLPFPPIPVENAHSDSFTRLLANCVNSAFEDVPELRSGEAEATLNIFFLPVVQCKIQKLN